MAVCQIIFSITSDRIIQSGLTSRSLTKKLFSFFGFCGIACCQIVLVFTGCDAILTVAILCATLAFSALLYGGYISNAIDLTPEYAGTVYGCVNSIGNLTGILAPIITDRITDDGTRAEWNVVFFMSAALAMLGATFYSFLGSSERRHYGIAINRTRPADFEASEHLAMMDDDRSYGAIQK